jgi:DNA-binding response OmpR family regulator
MIIDMMMPEVDGAQVIRTLRERKQLPPTLIMSGMVSDEVLESTGIDLRTNYISKPFTIQELAEKLDGLMKVA